MGGRLPTGTVAFLFTDIEDSTRKWDADRDAMAAAVAQHDELVRRGIEGNGGVVFATGGDSFSAAFDDPDDAVDAAVAIQRALGAAVWPGDLTISVRAGVHVGSAYERGGDYFGPTVNRAARVSDAGHGGQIVVSGVTADLLTRHATADLGQHRLRGVSDPLTIRQVLADGLCATFPPLRSRTSAVSTLPTPLTTLFGRDDEVADLVRMLDEFRLITLTGVGGSGKTRLAIAAGDAGAGAFPDGTFFVDLSRIHDERQVAQAFADGIGFSSGENAPIEQQLRDLLAPMRALLVVDNCEHVLDAAADMVEFLLEAAPQVTVLATSREALDVEGERAIRVRSLDLLGNGPAVALFCDRAASHLPAPTPRDRETIAEICRRLDGLPLAIELAAARTKLFSPEQLLERLADRFRILTAGRRRTRGRQQTLEATIDWSYDLLEPEEQRALQCLSVMPGAFSLDLATAVLGTDDAAAVDLLDGLVSRSLVQPTAWILGGTGYRLLETIRVYATDKLLASADPDSPRRRHADHLVAALYEARSAWVSGIAALADDVVAAYDWAVATEAESQLELSLVRGLVHIVRQQDDAASSMMVAALEATDRPAVSSIAHAYLGFLEGRRTGQRQEGLTPAAEHLQASIDAAAGSEGAFLARQWRAYGLASFDGEAFDRDVEEMAAFGELPWSAYLAIRLLDGLRAHWNADFTRARSLYLEGLDECHRTDDEMQRVCLVTGLLSAAAMSDAPAQGIEWLQTNRHQVDAAPWLLTHADGVATFAVAYLAVADLMIAAGDRPGAIDAIDRFLEIRSRRLMHLPVCDNELGVSLALLAHRDGDAARAAELIRNVGMVTFARPAHRAIVQLEIDAIPRDEWRDRLPALAWTLRRPVDEHARDRAVRRSLTELGLADP